ncbi:MAG: hypothetical protein RJB26_2583 [Pseudomonadota bacterium]|jgi:hypothetical protein
MTTPLEQATRELLRSRAESLDGRLRSRLNRARQVALDELAPPGRWSRTPILPLAAALGAAAVALLLLLPHGTRRSPAPVAPVAVAALDDSDLMGAGGEGLLDEDPTLFALAAADEAAK